MDEQSMRRRRDRARKVIEDNRDAYSERPQRDLTSAIDAFIGRDTRSETHPPGIRDLTSSPLQGNQKPSLQRQQLIDTLTALSGGRSMSRRDLPYLLPRSRGADDNDKVPVQVQVSGGGCGADHKKKVGNNPPRSDKTPRDTAITIDGSGTASSADHQTTEEQRERSAVKIEERRERCYKYSQKALAFAICTFCTYLTPASSSAGKMAFILSMAAFFVAICADFFSWRRKPRDGGHALVYLSSSSLMLMTFLMFISFNSYYGFAIPILPLIIGAGLVKHKLRSPRHRQQNTTGAADGGGGGEFNKLLSDVFDFSALILNSGGFVAVFSTTTTMHSFSGANEYSFLGFMLLLTVITSLYLMMATTVRTPLLTLNVNYLYSILQLLLLVMVIVFIANKMNG